MGKLPGGQQEQGHGVVPHDQGEGDQQPKHFRSRNREVTHGANEVSQVQIKKWDHCIVRYEYDLIVQFI